MLTSSNGNLFWFTGPLWGKSTGHLWFPSQRPVTRSFGVFFDLPLNKRVSKQSIPRWYETPSRSLWRHYNEDGTVLLVEDKASYPAWSTPWFLMSWDARSQGINSQGSDNVLPECSYFHTERVNSRIAAMFHDSWSTMLKIFVSSICSKSFITKGTLREKNRVFVPNTVPIDGLAFAGAGTSTHYIDIMMGAKASQITSLTIVYSTVYSGADQRKYQSSASLAFVRGIHRGPVNSPHKGPVTLKMFPFDVVIVDAVWSSTVRMHTVLALNSLVPGKYGCDFWNANFNLALLIGIFRSSYDNRWMPWHITDKSTLVQVMAWCCQAPSHCLNQCWPSST